MNNNNNEYPKLLTDDEKLIWDDLSILAAYDPGFARSLFRKISIERQETEKQIKSRESDIKTFAKELKTLNDVIRKCAKIVIEKTGVQVFQCNPPGNAENIKNTENPSDPQYDPPYHHILDIPSLIEDALSVALEKPPLSSSGELSDDFTDGVKFACRVIRDNYSKPEILRIQLKIIQNELKYRLAIKLFKKDLQKMNTDKEFKFTKETYNKLAIVALGMSDEEYENHKLEK